MNTDKPIWMRIIYDNNPFDEKLKKDWGFSCFIKGLEKSILFDTGRYGHILLSNMEKLGIRPEDFDLVFLSHFHKDHTGSLETLLDINSKITVWLPEFFPEDFKQSIRKKGAKLVEVIHSQQICKGAFTTGVVDGWVKEQSLVLKTDGGLALITGCAHPRIVNIISKVKNAFNDDDMKMAGSKNGLASTFEKTVR